MHTRWGPAPTMGELPVEHTDRWHPASFIPYIRCVVFYRLESLISRNGGGGHNKNPSPAPTPISSQEWGRITFINFPPLTRPHLSIAHRRGWVIRRWHCARCPCVHRSALSDRRRASGNWKRERKKKLTVLVTMRSELELEVLGVIVKFCRKFSYLCTIQIYLYNSL